MLGWKIANVLHAVGRIAIRFVAFGDDCAINSCCIWKTLMLHLTHVQVQRFLRVQNSEMALRVCSSLMCGCSIQALQVLIVELCFAGLPNSKSINSHIEM